MQLKIMIFVITAPDFFPSMKTVYKQENYTFYVTRINLDLNKKLIHLRSLSAHKAATSYKILFYSFLLSQLEIERMSGALFYNFLLSFLLQVFLSEKHWVT